MFFKEHACAYEKKRNISSYYIYKIIILPRIFSIVNEILIFDPLSRQTCFCRRSFVTGLLYTHWRFPVRFKTSYNSKSCFTFVSIVFHHRVSHFVSLELIFQNILVVQLVMSVDLVFFYKKKLKKKSCKIATFSNFTKI